MHQRRHFSRLQALVPDLVCSPTTSLGRAMKVRDFSPSGIGFVADHSLVVDSPFELRVRTKQFSVVVDAQVRWCKKDDFSDARVGGIEFVNLTDEARSLLLIYYTQLLLDEFPQQ